MRTFLIALAFAVFVVVALAPPGFLMVDALFREGRLTLDNYGVLLSEPRVWNLLLHSVFLGGGTALLAGLVGVPFGFVLARFRVRYKPVLRTLYLVPVMLPTYITGIAWTEHVDLAGFPGALFLLAVCYWPVAALFAERGFRGVGRGLEEAALTSGGPWKAFFRVSLPLAAPSVLAGMLLVFVLTVGDFGIPDFLSFAGSRTYQVYTLEIFNRWSVLHDTGTAVGAALPLVLLAGAAVWGVVHLEGRGTGSGIASAYAPISERSPGRGGLPVILFTFSAVGASTGVPLATLVLWIFQDPARRGVPALLREALVTAGPDTLNTVLTAVLASAAMVFAGFFIAYRIERSRGSVRTLLAACALLPLAFPPVMLAVADIRLWNNPANPLSEMVYDTPVELGLLYFARFIPIAVLSLRAAIRQVDPVLEDAARVSGRGDAAAFFRVLLPLAWGGVCAAFLLGYILCMRELDCVALVAAGNDTLPMRIYSQVHTSRDAAIGAMSLVLVFTLLVPPAVWRLLVRNRVDVL